MKLISIITVCIIMFLAGGCSNKKKFLEADFEATVDKAHKTNNPELILSYLANTSEIPDISKANACIQIGIIFIKNKNNEDAEQYFKKALILVDSKVGDMPALIRCTALLQLARIDTRKERYLKSKFNYEKLLEECTKHPDLSKKFNISKIYQELSSVYCALKDYKTQYELLNRALQEKNATNIKNDTEAALIYALMSDCCNNLAKYQNAVMWGKKSLETFKQEGKIYPIAISYYNIAQGLHGMKKNSEAINAIKASVEYSSKYNQGSNKCFKNASQLLKKWSMESERQ